MKYILLCPNRCNGAHSLPTLRSFDLSFLNAVATKRAAKQQREALWSAAAVAAAFVGDHTRTRSRKIALAAGACQAPWSTRSATKAAAEPPHSKALRA